MLGYFGLLRRRKAAEEADGGSEDRNEGGRRGGSSSSSRREARGSRKNRKTRLPQADPDERPGAQPLRDTALDVELAEAPRDGVDPQDDGMGDDEYDDEYDGEEGEGEEDEYDGEEGDDDEADEGKKNPSRLRSRRNDNLRAPARQGA